MARFDLTDFEWSVIQPLLPTKVRGVPRADDCKVLNGIFWVCARGHPGPRYQCATRPYTTCDNRFNY
ncbi:transposase [Labrenzia sp. MBR-25]|jgi:transposase